MNVFAAFYINSWEKNHFMSVFSNVVEQTPKVAEELYNNKPFFNNSHFLELLDSIIDGLSEEDQVRFKWIKPKSV